MRTKEVEALTGITAKNMQFYEAEGLLTPARNPKNRYREYSEEDVERLKQIRTLRMLDIPIAEIRKALADAGGLEACLHQRKVKITEEIHSLEIQRDLCEVFIHQEKRLEDLCELDYGKLEQDISDYKYRLEQLKRKDRRKARRGYILALGAIVICGVPALLYIIMMTLEASQSRPVMAAIWIVLLIMTGNLIWQAVKDEVTGWLRNR